MQRIIVKDKGWAWVIVMSAGLILFIQRGIISGFTLTFQQFLTRFGSSRSTTSWIYTIHSMSGMLVAPLTGALGKKYSYRQVTIFGGLLYCIGACLTSATTHVFQAYFTYGLISGIGMGMTTVSSLIMINLYFDKRKSIAIAIAYVLNSFGAIVLVPALSFSYDYYGYSGTMLLLGGVASHMCISGSLFRPTHQFDSQISNSLTTKEKLFEYFDISLLSNRIFVFYCIMMMSFSYSASSHIVILAGFAEERGLTHTQIATMISIAGAIGIPVRICTGILCDRQLVRRHRITIFSAATVLTAIIVSAMPFTSSVSSFITVNIVYSFVSSIIGVQEPVVMADITGVKKVAGGVGISRVFRAVGIFFGPSLAGYIKDKRGSYNLSYWIAGSFILCTVTQFSLVRVYTGARPATEETIKELAVEEEEFFTSKDCNDEKMTISNNKEIDLEN